MSKIKNIVFDFGGVLIDWNPQYLYKKVFDNEEDMDYFLENICTPEWNMQQDAGRSLANGTKILQEKHPDYKELIGLYYQRWEEMLGEAIEGTVDILKQLIDSKQFKVVALTNWSHETFPIALDTFDFLHWFEGILVSGEEKTRKPFKDIYELTLNRFNIEAEKSVFIDDNLRNINAAKELGINTIHFQNPDQLKAELKSFDIVI